MQNKDSTSTTNINTPSSPMAPSSHEMRRVVDPTEIAAIPSGPFLRKLGDIGPLVITLMNAIGWVVVYFMVLSPQVDQNRAQTKLFAAQLEKLQSAHQKLIEQLEVQERSGKLQLDDTNRRFIELQISRLEGATARLEDQLANLRTRTQATTDLNSVRQSLRPNLLYGKFDFTFPERDEVRLEHEIRNIGLNAVFVDAPTLRLSIRPITDGVNNDALLVPNRDYSVQAVRPGMFQPGSTARVAYSIKLLKGTLTGKIYYELQWSSSTDVSSVSTAARILGNQISKAELKKLSQFTQVLEGTITFSR